MKKVSTVLSGIVLATLSQQGIADTGYQVPSKAMSDVVDAKLTQRSIVSPDNAWLVLSGRKVVKELDDLAITELKLAGVTVNPQNFTRTRARGALTDLTFKRIADNKEVKVSGLPKGDIFSPAWSPNSRYLAFYVTESHQATLFIFDVDEEALKKIDNVSLNTTITSRPFRWLSDSSGIVANLAANYGKRPPSGALSQTTPIISETKGNETPVRTYQNLLSSPQDKALFKFYAAGQLAKVDLKGRIQRIGEPALYRGFRASPDNSVLLVGKIKEPFSYIVTYSRFATDWEIRNFDGSLVKTLERQGLAENIPQGVDSVRTERRQFEWRADKPATVVWAQAQDGGSMKNQVDYHDHIYSLAAPFNAKPTLLAKVKNRLMGIRWGNDTTMLVYGYKHAEYKMQMHLHNPSDPNQAPTLFNERSRRDAYKNPGNFVFETTKYGTQVIKIVDKQYTFLSGNGASPQGNIPFLDRYNLNTGKKERLWQSESPYYERITAMLDDEGSQLVTLRESKTEIPNYYLRDRTAGTLRALTDYEHPYPQFKNIKKELVKYTREDGVELSGTLYLPDDYKKSDGPLPVLMWAYPLEFKNKSVAGQVRDSPYQFSRIGHWGPMPLLSKGIAIFDDPKMPIIGVEGEEPNDTFRKQLVSSAEAAVNTLVTKGIADKDKIMIAGHSYGAFMVANLLAHSDLFVAGIARSGAYNRSLTPFGFQGEPRHFWEAQSVYANMSPFFHVDKINEPMLLIHGKEDPNSGTYPMQSERMYNAMKGMGKKARLVMLPHEGHGYRAKESILHVLWEQEQWVERYLLNEQAH